MTHQSAGRFAGKAVVITGAGSGIGRAGALAFAREGAKVVIADVAAEPAQRTAAEITRAGGTALAVTTDVTRLTDVQRLMQQATQAFGGIDVLWNNAGVLARPVYLAIEETDVEDWERVLRINLTGVLLGFKCVVPQMKKQGKGVIINTASLAGLRGQAAGMAAYSASKGAVVNLTRMLATELGPFNIRVNAIAPGSVETPLIADLLRQNAGATPATEAMRVARPEEIAETVLHLAADGTGPLTGAIVTIDGGRSAR